MASQENSRGDITKTIWSLFAELLQNPDIISSIEDEQILGMCAEPVRHKSDVVRDVLPQPWHEIQFIFPSCIR